MFTGIISDIGLIIDVVDHGIDKSFVIRTGFDLARIGIGASIACSGCCLTVVKKGDNNFTVDVSAETLSKTNLDDWKKGAQINLEQSLKLGDELGGHIVSGHVDGLAVLESVTQEGESRRLVFSVPDEFAKFIAPKGSIALDGISLTVNEVDKNTFGVNIIPHTWDVTTIGQRQAGDRLNFEVDMLARYVARMHQVG